MGDSDNSRTLPIVTRRKLLAGTATAAMTQFVHTKSSAAASMLKEEDISDPLLILWQHWRVAHFETMRLCQEQQRLETRLMAEVGFPLVKITAPGQGEPFYVFTMESIDGWLGDHSESANERARAKAELAASQARWDEADRRIGYSPVREAEILAAKREDQLVEALWATPAQSLAGVAAKLDAVLCNGQPCDDSDEFPWPQLRSLLSDIIRLGALGHLAAQIG
jgi:hypothetical protein